MDISRDILINQIQRDSNTIAQSFDRLCTVDIQKMSDVYAEICVGTFVSTAAPDTLDGVRKTCLTLTMNALKSVTAGVLLLRAGYRLQPGILVRNVLETVSTVFYLSRNATRLNDVLSGAIQSPATISAAKEILPVYGRLYGFFSDQFAHVGEFHHEFHPLVTFSSRDDDSLRHPLLWLKIALWLIYVSTELVFYDHFSAPKFWNRQSPGCFTFDPLSETNVQWARDYFGPEFALIAGSIDTEPSSHPA